MKQFLASLSIASLCLPLCSAPAQAGAWTQGAGETQLITTALYYRADTHFDTTGNLTAQAPYTKLEANPYIEYGLMDGLTIGASLFLDRLDDSSNTQTGLGDSQWFVRKRIYQDAHYVLSVQPEIKLPSPQAYSTHTPVLGSRYVDLGGRVLGGYSDTLLGYAYYTDIEAAYHYRSGSPGDQALFDATAGLHVTDDITAMAQVFQTLSMVSLAGSSFTESPGDNYDLTTVQLSGLYQFAPDKSLQLGVFDNVAGRNTGRGGGVIIAFWKTF